MAQRPASLSRETRPPHLVLDVPTEPYPSSNLPQLTSQLALEATPAPLQMESPYAPSNRSMGSSTSNSQGSIYGYGRATESSPSISMAGSSIMVPRARTYEASAGMVPAFTYQQLVPHYTTHTHPVSRTPFQTLGSPSSSVTWSETYPSAPSTSYSTSPLYSTGAMLMQPTSAGPGAQYAQNGYQHLPMHVYPAEPEGSTSTPAHYAPVMSSPQLDRHPHGAMYQATGAPHAPCVRAAEHDPSEGGLDSGPGPVRNRVRRKVAIGRVRLPEPDHMSPSLTPTGRVEDPWSKMAQSQTLSGAFTHSGVYGMDPSVSTCVPGQWTGEGVVQPGRLMLVDSFPFETTAPQQRPSTIEGYYPSGTAGLYMGGSVSVPATVATSHVPLPLVSQMPPPLTMSAWPTSVLGTSALQAGTPASLCHSTFTSEHDQTNDYLSSDLAYDEHHGGKSSAPTQMSSRSGGPSKASPALRVASSDFDGVSMVPLLRSRTPHALHGEDDVEELRDVRSVYPALSAAHELSSAAEGDSILSAAGWHQAGPSGRGGKRIVHRSATANMRPAHFDGKNYSRLESRSSHPKLTIACEGCRKKKLKSVGIAGCHSGARPDELFSPP
jgi:hypothetical protein